MAVDIQMLIASVFGLSHSPTVGAQRYVDALVGGDAYPVPQRDVRGKQAVGYGCIV